MEPFLAGRGGCGARALKNILANIHPYDTTSLLCKFDRLRSVPAPKVNDYRRRKRQTDPETCLIR